ncbi:MAG: hypothetical protein ACREUU_21685 [Gammaproteobacteria bacterium]
MEVLGVVYGGGVQVGDRIFAEQFGGVYDDVIHESQDNPLLRIPGTYLLFLDIYEPGVYAAPPWGRFEVVAPGFLSVVAAEYWADLPAVSQLNGLTVDAAAALITASVGLPIPPLPTAPPTPTPHVLPGPSNTATAVPPWPGDATTPPGAE